MRSDNDLKPERQGMQAISGTATSWHGRQTDPAVFWGDTWALGLILIQSPGLQKEG